MSGSLAVRHQPRSVTPPAPAIPDRQKHYLVWAPAAQVDTTSLLLSPAVWNQLVTAPGPCGSAGALPALLSPSSPSHGAAPPSVRRMNYGLCKGGAAFLRPWKSSAGVDARRRLFELPRTVKPAALNPSQLCPVRESSGLSHYSKPAPWRQMKRGAESRGIKSRQKVLDDGQHFDCAQLRANAI